MKRWLSCILLIIICLTVSGCWNYREIDWLSIVAGFGIDRDPANGDIILYAEIVETSQSGKESSIQSKIVESRGKTVFDANRNLVAVTGKRCYWSDAQILIVSEALAKEGILDIIDWFYRDAEPRLTIHLFVAQNADPKSILASKEITNKIRSYQIHDALKNKGVIEKYPKSELYTVVGRLSFDVPYNYSPSITIRKRDNSDVAEINGTAVFKGDKLQGFLDADDTMYFLYITDQIEGGLLANNALNGNRKDDISLEIFSNKTTVKPSYKNDTLAINISTKTETAIDESGPTIDFTNKAGIKAVISGMEKFLQQNIIRVIKKVQNEFDADIFGFGETVYQDMPDVWKKYKNNWDTEFKRLEFTLTSEIKIRNTAIAAKAIKGGK